MKNSINWNKGQDHTSTSGYHSKLFRQTFDFTASNKYSGMSCLHYACQFPSLTMIIDLLCMPIVNPLAIDTCLRVPSELIPLSHLTSKKSLLVYEKERIFQRFYPKPEIFENGTPKYSILGGCDEKMQVPFERSPSFEDNDESMREVTQRPRCFPSKATIFITAKTPSEKTITKKPFLKIPKKFECSLQDLSKANKVPSTNVVSRNTFSVLQKPIRLNLRVIPSFKLTSSGSIHESVPGLNKEKAVERLADKLKAVKDSNGGAENVHAAVRELGLQLREQAVQGRHIPSQHRETRGFPVQEVLDGDRLLRGSARFYLQSDATNRNI